MTDLLEPTLESQPRLAIYSSNALFWVAFLGGAFAVTIMAAVNSYKLQQLGKQWWLFVAAIVFSFVVINTIFLFSGPEIANDYVKTYVRLLVRGLGLLLFGGFYYLQRAHYRSQKTFGTKPLQPWLMAISAILIGAVLTFGAAFSANWMGAGIS